MHPPIKTYFHRTGRDIPVSCEVLGRTCSVHDPEWVPSIGEVTVTENIYAVEGDDDYPNNGPVFYEGEILDPERDELEAVRLLVVQREIAHFQEDQINALESRCHYDADIVQFSPANDYDQRVRRYAA